MLIDSLREVPFYCMSFDESYNNVLEKRQIDLHVRYWEHTKNHGVKRYLHSSFMGKSSADDVYSHFNSCAETLVDANCLQVSSNGPSMNLAFLYILNEDRSEADIGKKLLELETFGLHLMLNAFKHGENASAQDIKTILSAMCKIFHGSPSL